MLRQDCNRRLIRGTEFRQSLNFRSCQLTVLSTEGRRRRNNGYPITRLPARAQAPASAPTARSCKPTSEASLVGSNFMNMSSPIVRKSPRDKAVRWSRDGSPLRSSEDSSSDAEAQQPSAMAPNPVTAPAPNPNPAPNPAPSLAAPTAAVAGVVRPTKSLARPRKTPARPPAVGQVAPPPLLPPMPPPAAAPAAFPPVAAEDPSSSISEEEVELDRWVNPSRHDHRHARHHRRARSESPRSSSSSLSPPPRRHSHGRRHREDREDREDREHRDRGRARRRHYDSRSSSRSLSPRPRSRLDEGKKYSKEALKLFPKVPFSFLFVTWLSFFYPPFPHSKFPI